MTDLAGPRMKLRRADQHLNALKRRIKRLGDSDPYSFVVEREEGSRDYVIRCRFNREPPSIYEWGVVVGDFAHNARSALNVLVCELSAEADKKDLQFPVCLSRKDYTNRVKKDWLKSVPETHRSMIESFQPYHGSGVDDPLRLLTQINNADKHRVISVVTAFPEFNGIIWKRSGRMPYRVSGRGRIALVGRLGDAPQFDCRLVRNGVIAEDGAVVAKGVSGPGEVIVDPDVKVAVQFGDACEGVALRPVVDTLTTIRDRLKEVLGSPW